MIEKKGNTNMKRYSSLSIKVPPHTKVKGFTYNATLLLKFHVPQEKPKEIRKFRNKSFKKENDMFVTSKFEVEGNVEFVKYEVLFLGRLIKYYILKPYHSYDSFELQIFKTTYSNNYFVPNYTPPKLSKADITKTVKIANHIVVCTKCKKRLNIDESFINKISPNISNVFKKTLINTPKELKKYGANTCKNLVNFLAQSQVETKNFTALRESLNYTKRTFKNGENVYRISPTAINKGFTRKGLGHYSRKQKIAYIEKYLMDNDIEYGKHLYGHNSYPNNDYRGRGYIHLTHYDTYKKFKDKTNINVVTNPTLLETNHKIALKSAVWFWKNKKNGAILVEAEKDTSGFTDNDVTNAITKLVNTGMQQKEARKKAKIRIGKIFVAKYGECK